MPPKTPTASNQLTQRDLEILSAAWGCFEGQPTINWGKLAQETGLKNASTARACFTPIKKKLMSNASPSASPTNTNTAASPQAAGGSGKKKRAASSALGEPKNGQTKKTKTTKDLDLGNVGDDDLKVKKKKDDDHVDMETIAQAYPAAEGMDDVKAPANFPGLKYRMEEEDEEEGY